MQDKTYAIEGTTKTELDTEVKFVIATSKYDKVDLLKFSIDITNEENESARIASVLTKVLSNLKKNGIIKFYVKSEDILCDSTEANYLRNKFPHIEVNCNNANYIYVML